MTFTKSMYRTYTEYRHGKPKPVTLPRVFKHDDRRHVIHDVIDIMSDWRHSPFENEGSTRAGIRSALCLQGYRWEVSDHEAALLVGEAIKAVGAARPSWEQGQRDYYAASVYCRWCAVPLPEEEQLGQRNGQYCSGVCAKAALTYRIRASDCRDRSIIETAYRAVRREASPERTCEECGISFKPFAFSRVSQKYCTTICRDKANRKYHAKPCAVCQEPFFPKRPSQYFCSKACMGESMKTIQERTCSHCGDVFRPKNEWGGRGNFCSKECTYASLRVPKFERVCGCCGEPFLAKMARAKYCSRKCILVMDKRKRRQTPAVIPFVPMHMLTAEVFDGWFRRAA